MELARSVCVIFRVIAPDSFIHHSTAVALNSDDLSGLRQAAGTITGVFRLLATLLLANGVIVVGEVSSRNFYPTTVLCPDSDARSWNCRLARCR